MVGVMVMLYFYYKIEKTKYGVMVAIFYAKNGIFKMSYGNSKKSIFSKIW
jgi:hypothetical protein